MSRKKGVPKTGGRKLGVPNTVTKELRERIKIFLEGNFDLIMQDFKTLQPDRRLTLYEKYLKYVLPSLQNSSFDLNIEKLSDDDLTKFLSRLIMSKNDTKSSGIE